MEDKILNLTQKIEKKRQKRKIWKNIFTSLAIIVVFCTTYALILPAITKSRTSYCGFESHVHEEACYEDQLICTLEEDVPIADPEVEYHTHEEACYTTKTDLVCTIESQEVHLHSEECKQIESINVCGLEENEEHAHTEECFIEQESIICGKEEVAEAHIHEEACYETTIVLTCEKEEIPLPEGHVHEDGCYEKKLICEKEEHEHVLMCYSNRNADLETKDDWEATVPKELTGVWADDLLAVAKSQLGYKESIANYIVADDDETKGYTRYGDWYGDAYGDWCAMFISFCMNYAQIPENALGYEANCQNWVEKLQERDEKAELAAAMVETATMEESTAVEENTDTESVAAHTFYQYAGTYIPKPGDIVFFEVSRENWANHVGIVTEVILTEEDSEEESLGQIKTIEGNASDAVSERTYKLEDTSILGYGALPENPDVLPPIMDGENTSAGLPEDSTVTEAPVPEEILITRQTITAAIYTDETLTQIAEDDNTVITITGLLPEEVTAKAYPVVMENTVVDGKNLVFAYDITLYDKDGVLIENQESEYPITVTIEPAEWGEGSEDTNPEDYQIYYIPEDGEPEPMETEGSEEAVSFTTDHFSVYALAVNGTMDNVYINGTSGNDNNNNAGSSGAPVKTFAKAFALVKQGGTIYVAGTVTISDAQAWDLGTSNVTIKRINSSFTGPLIVVASGGSLELANITIHGGSGNPKSIDTTSGRTTYRGRNTTYADNYVKAPLIVVKDDGILGIHDGAVLTNNSNYPDKNNSGYFKENTTNRYVGQGGAIYCEGILTMNGGTIQNCEAHSGGGIYIENGDFYFNGGTIDSNVARDIYPYASRQETFYRNAGGGVYVGDYSTMTMTGGIISNNKSTREGGGVSIGWLDRSNGAAINDYITTFTMTGGTFTGNIATSTGGGLNVTAGRQAFISSGHFTNNIAYGIEYQAPEDYTYEDKVYSGGGIYLDAQQLNSNGGYAGVPGKAVINKVIVTDNTAESYGGGIASCSTSSTYIYSYVDLNNGTAIYNNKSQSNTKSNELFLNKNRDVSTQVLGGGSYNWTSSDIYETYYGQQYYMGTGYDNSLISTSPEIIKAEDLATVYITNNTAYMGGGIGCNGIIEIGGEQQTTYISITKLWENAENIELPEYITVQIYQGNQPYGDPIKIVRIYSTIDGDGNRIWPIYYVGGLPAGKDYSIKEVEINGFNATITKDGKNFIITNKPKGFTVVKEWVDDTENDRPKSIQVQLYQKSPSNPDGIPYGEPEELTAEGKWSYSWINLPKEDSKGNEYTYFAKEIDGPDGYYSTSDGAFNDAGEWVITNTKSPKTSVSIEKRWAEGTPVADYVDIQLYSNGNKYGNPITLSDANGWFHKWNDLPLYNSRKETIEYTVEELNMGGYTVDIAEGKKEDVASVWTEVSSLTPGKEYLFVNNDSVLAGTSSGGLQLIQNASFYIQNGAEPSENAVWNYSNQKLKNDESMYLKLKEEGFLIWKTYSFVTSTSGDSITYENKMLKIKDYFLGNIQDGSGTAEESSGIEFTAYEWNNPSENWGDKHYVVTNSKETQVELPETGSFGSAPIIILGLVTFLAVSIFLLYGEEIKMRR